MTAISPPGSTKFQIDLRRHLREEEEDRDLTRVICEIADASKYIINAIRTGDLGLAGTSNLYGENQLALDVLSDRILRKRMIHSGVVANILSEETSEVIEVDPGGKYSVAFDPLDGSSLVDVNLAVGTIVTIYEGSDLLQSGRNQVAAMYILYGPRTSLVYSTGRGVHEFCMNQLMEFTLTKENIQLQPSGNIYAPGGQRNLYTEGTEKYVSSLEEKGYKLRYSGGFVPDINQILLKGSGIFLYPHLRDKPKGKLRLIFELNPMAYLIEQAGGKASTGRQSILDIKPESIDDCAPIFIGCREDVERAEEYIARYG
ncbi:D-fructose 1,6-bisphosphatase [Geoalkalibacter ferrihydriticus]|uniref:Fructose-1,6-bisphosphatase class 1 n=2 Tax=Geoalkalibacter ferrihydriticus TaxID=392333 RepID=A0A0C2HNA4_9BACT|nr:class 1 fructose-bisphosphatase [Geoalkalibacter ferrihydriticus]KIH76430.1 fructose 1,6-bisphosphatase [Geoalkalibacter ferrihydriticus DSM 17813]SDL94369.1 D-fructose 1,6-bisphosphatase [Geoalkalibacter ferrihydriticus]